MTPRLPSRAAVAALLALAAVSSTACRRAPSDLREWRATDHDSGPLEPVPSEPAPANDDPLAAARALWSVQCALCHGTQGRGDGPQAAMTRPADLTAPELQSSRSDADLATAITNGRGRMPSFGGSVRPEGVQQLVRLIRSWRRQ